MKLLLWAPPVENPKGYSISSIEGFSNKFISLGYIKAVSEPHILLYQVHTTMTTLLKIIKY